MNTRILIEIVSNGYIVTVNPDVEESIIPKELTKMFDKVIPKSEIDQIIEKANPMLKNEIRVFENHFDMMNYINNITKLN
jgi:CRISPR/Cas system CMR subunit Cmr6 (Cas7 group RAMP superfamily)